MRIRTLACLALLANTMLSHAARADYFVWRDEKSGLSLSFPDTWRIVQGRQKDDILTIMAPSGRANAACRVRIDIDGRFLIYPPRLQDAEQRLNFSRDFWGKYIGQYDDATLYDVRDGSGLGQGFAGYADAGYTSAIPGPEMPRRGILFATNYYGKLYVIECSAHRDAFQDWKGPFMSIVKSVDFKPAYHQLETGDYQDFTPLPRVEYRSQQNERHEVY